MSDPDEIREWLLKTIQLIVDRPDEVTVETVPRDQRITFRIRVHQGDVGKVIGRQARTARPLRVLAGAMGMKIRKRLTVDIEEDTERT